MKLILYKQKTIVDPDNLKYKIFKDILKKDKTINVPAFEVEAVDTTAAGDTFIGYFLSAYSTHTDSKTALTRACAASALAVMQVGAAQSIPSIEDVNRFLAKQ